eukprot:gene3291-3774_t
MAGNNGPLQIKDVKCNSNILVKHRTALSKNKTVALCGCGNKIAVFSMKTGKIVRKLEGHQSAVVDFYFRKKNPLQVISAAKDGEIILWDYTDGTIIKRIPFSHSICSMLQHPKQDDVVYVSKKNSSGKKNGKKFSGLSLMKIDLNVAKRNKNNSSFCHETICTVGGGRKKFAVSSRGEYVASIKGPKLKIYSETEKKLSKFSFGSKMLTCVAFHPTKLMIATGIDQGKIVLWQGFDNLETPITTELHWHAQTVADLAFTNDGLYLLSGGVEAVLVSWQLETLEKDFTPRLGAAIEHLSVSDDDTLVAVSFSNNVVNIISAVDKKLKCSLKGLSKGGCSVLKYDPRTENLVLPASPAGYLQFYDPDQDSVSHILDVVGQNYLAGSASNITHSTQVLYYDFSYNGNWLATIEKTSFQIISNEVKLKFWEFDAKNQSYKQNTIVDPPHEIADDITSLKMRPRPETSVFEHMAVTTDCGGKFKIWTLAHPNEDEDAKFQRTWTCHAICYYGSGPCGTGSFSEDGSLLAVVYGKTITIWDSEVGELKTSLYSPVQNETVSEIVFGRGPSAAYMIAKTNHYLICWNLLTCSVWWSLEAKVTCLAADRFSGLFAAFATVSKTKNKLYFFAPATPKPFADMPECLEQGTPISAVFADKLSSFDLISGQVGQLYFLTSEKNIYKISSEIDTNIQTEKMSGHRVQSEFEKIFGFNAEKSRDTTNNAGEQQTMNEVPSSELIRKVLSTPSHVLPSVKTLCSSFFQSLSLISHSVASEEDGTKEEVEEKEEDESDIESSNEDHNRVERKVLESNSLIDDPNEKTVTKPSNLSMSTETNFNWLSDFIKLNYSE